MTRRNAMLMGAAFVLAGLYPLAVAIGVAHPAPATVHAPLWVVGLAGACFVLVGTAFLAPRDDVRMRGLVVGLTVTSLAIIFDWIAFGPGERHFSGGISFVGAAVRTSDETAGRVAFGIAALLLDAFALWGWYRWMRPPRR